MQRSRPEASTVTNGPEGASLSPEAVGGALRAAAPYVLSIMAAGWLVQHLPLG